MNDDWRPNWRDEKAYLQFEDGSGTALAWEFLRRSEAYSNTWREDPREAMEWVNEMPIPGTEPDADELSDYLYWCQYFMVLSLYHPSTMPEAVRFCPNTLQWQTYGLAHETTAPNDLTIHSPEEVVIKFRLDSAIKDQVDQASQLLDLLRHDYQKARRLSTAKTRLRDKDRKPYAKCLRLLDGIAQGETQDVIGAELFDGTNGAKRVKELMQTAKAFTKWRFRELVMEKG